jgi:hypothetical protein
LIGSLVRYALRRFIDSDTGTDSDVTCPIIKNGTATMLSRSNNSSVCPLSTPSEELNEPFGILDSQPVFNTADDAIFERVCRQLENLLNSAEEAILTPIQLSNGEDDDDVKDGKDILCNNDYDNYSTISTTLLDNIDTNHQSNSVSSIERNSRDHLPHRLRNVHTRCKSDQMSVASLSPISFNAWYDSQTTHSHHLYDSLIQSTSSTSSTATTVSNKHCIIEYHSIIDNHYNDYSNNEASTMTVIQSPVQQHQQYASSTKEQWMSSPLRALRSSFLDWYQQQTTEKSQTPIELLSEFPILIYHIYRRISALFTWLIRLLMACWHHRGAFFRLLYRLLSLLRRAKTIPEPILCKTCHQPINRKKNNYS